MVPCWFFSAQATPELIFTLALALGKDFKLQKNNLNNCPELHITTVHVQFLLQRFKWVPLPIENTNQPPSPTQMNQHV
jgi:hypothetical protein